MARSRNEWIGKTDDTAIPPRVKQRIFDKCNGRCSECQHPLDGINKPQFDHVVALINGGEHAEFNLQTLCEPCHSFKTGQDVSEKSRVHRKRAKHLGFNNTRSMTRWRKFNGDIVQAPRHR